MRGPWGVGTSLCNYEHHLKDIINVIPGLVAEHGCREGGGGKMGSMSVAGFGPYRIHVGVCTVKRAPFGFR